MAGAWPQVWPRIFARGVRIRRSGAAGYSQTPGEYSPELAGTRRNTIGRLLQGGRAPPGIVPGIACERARLGLIY